mmetsp:Transcript_4499/g.10761  ORF Transcript_4499/g.10761 Transcript_4499/m.10761 type:complete len:211 (+) Transcript_4499:68-700(+)
MSDLEFLYFDGPGRGNLARMALHAGKVSFKDTRLTFDTWPAVKSDPSSVPSQLFGSLPCLKAGDTILAESLAVATYAAELGIYKTNTPTPEARAVDLMVMLTNEDLKKPMYKCLFGDDASKEAGKEALPAAVAPKLAALERALERSGGGTFFSGEKLGMADLAVFDSIKSPFPGLEALGVDLGPYPKLRAVAAAVGEVPEIKAFVAAGFR